MMLTASTTSNAGARASVAARPIAPRRARAVSAVVVRADAAAAEAKSSGVEKSVPSLKPVLDIEAIKGILPHR
jgi:hypothetical protein